MILESVKDIVNLSIEDFNKLTNKELLKASNIMTSALNKRIRTQVKSGLSDFSPAIWSIKRFIGFDDTKDKIPHLSTAGLKGKQSKLRSYLIAVINISKDKTLSYKGMMEYREKMKKLLPEDIFGDKDKESEFWKAYTRFMDDYHYREVIDESNQVVKWMRENVDSKDSADEILKKLLEQMKMDEDDRFGVEEEKVQVDNNGKKRKKAKLPGDGGDIPF